MTLWNKQRIRCTLLLMLCITAFSALSQETIRIAVDEYPPFQGSNLPNHGIGGQLVSEAYTTMGVTVEYGYFPWSRAKHYVAANSLEWDASSMWAKTEKHLEMFLLSDAFLDFEVVFFHLKTRNFDWETLEDLKTVSIGIPLGYSMGDVLDRWEKEKQVTIYRTTDERNAFEMLLRERFDVALNDVIVGRILLKESFTPESAAKITPHPKPLAVRPAHLIFSKENPKAQYWVDTFNEGLKRLKESGRYDEIVGGESDSR